MSNLEVRTSFKVFQSDLVLPSAMILDNVCQRDYAPTVDGIQQLFPL